MLYQAGSRRNSSPTLEVGVFLLEKDKWLSILLTFLFLLFLHCSTYCSIFFLSQFCMHELWYNTLGSLTVIWLCVGTIWHKILKAEYTWNMWFSTIYWKQKRICCTVCTQTQIPSVPQILRGLYYIFPEKSMSIFNISFPECSQSHEIHKDFSNSLIFSFEFISAVNK